LADVVVAAAEVDVSADADVELSDALVELSFEHADRPNTAIAAMVAAVMVLR
jgi:hypothetical protein